MKRRDFEEYAASITGLTVGSVRVMMKIERNRKANGRYAPGYRYVVTSKRTGTTVVANRD